MTAVPVLSRVRDVSAAPFFVPLDFCTAVPAAVAAVPVPSQPVFAQRVAAPRYLKQVTLLHLLVSTDTVPKGQVSRVILNPQHVQRITRSMLSIQRPFELRFLLHLIV